MALSSKEISEIINNSSNIERLEKEQERYDMYHGRLRDYIKKAIQREFILAETVRQLINRIIPANITQKVVNALAKVYITAPQRSPVNEMNKDQESIDSLTKAMDLNVLMKNANQYFKLSKHFCIEPFVNLGVPQMRVLAAHNYTPISDDPVDPTRATYIVKHVKWGNSKEGDKKSHRHVVWSDTEHYTMDGDGNIISDPNNPDNVNPYGILPIVYQRSQRDELIPIEDDDLVYMQVAVCLLLTDLAFATKYQAWSLIYILNSQAQNINFNPNSVIFLPANKEGTPSPEIGTIKPNIDSDAMLRQVETLIALLLSTKSLKSSAMSLNVETAQSGISKALDSAETMEDRTEQQAYFVEAEQKLFEIIKHQLPVWRSAGMLSDKYNTLSLTEDFELSVRFPTPKPIQSEKETVEVETMKLDKGFTTKKRALAVVNADLTSEQVDELEIEINKEKQESTENNDEVINNEDGEGDGEPTQA